MTKRKPVAAPERRASVGVALIAKDASKTLGACLDSLRPYVQQIVVGVDERTTDKTVATARSHGADDVFKVKVADWHECSRHGRVMAQHFANARNESFKHLDRSLDWWMWIDADDVFEGGLKLNDVLAKVNPECVGVWLPYRYSTLGDGKVTTTLFHRERLLRTTTEWEWVYRVHEVVKPKIEGAWYGTSELDMWHQEGQHRTEDSAARNLLLLEIDLEEDPNDSRAVFYIGNQYFAMGKNAEAAEWYQRLLQVGGNSYERWQSAVYMGHAHARMGDLNKAREAAYLALEEHPEHPEPYFLLASVAHMAGQVDKVEFWTAQGRRMSEAPFFVFKNPMDMGFNNRVCLADALARDGRIPEARREWEAAYAYYQDPSVAGAIERAKHMEMMAAHADRFVSFATYTNGDSHDLAIAEYAKLPEDVRAFGRVRDVAAPLMLAHRPETQPRIVFWCGQSWEPWAPPSINGSGIGGSETAVIEIARRFASDGWTVDVYNDADRFEGLYDGVGYWDCKRADPTSSADLLVSWRNPAKDFFTGWAKHRVLWCHDLNYGPLDSLGQWSKVLGVSAWHAQMLRDYYALGEDLVDFVPNGVDLDTRFSKIGDVAKVPMRCVYASSPDRGLVRLLNLWPRILSAEPGAELHVAYGWETIDRMIQRGRGDLAAFKDRVSKLIEATPGVTWHGRLPQDKLAELYGSAYAWVYPTSFLEVSCISAMEAMAGGAVPVTSTAGALKETIGDAGLLAQGLPESRPWTDFYVLQVLALLTDPNLRKPLSIRGRARAKELTWDKSYFEHWRPLASDLVLEQKTLAAV